MSVSFFSGRSGQVQILAAIVFLFLIPTTVIIAQNATNHTPGANISLIPNLSLEGNIIRIPLNTTNSSEGLNESLPEQTPENQTSEEFNETSDEGPASFHPNSTPNDTNQTLNETIPLNTTNRAGNQTVNETLPDNETSTNGTVVTLPDKNSTEIFNETGALPDSPVGSPKLIVSVQGPDKVVRGNNVTFSADITNTGKGTALQVSGFWKLPGITERPEFECGDIAPGESCTQEIVLSTNLGTSIGIKKTSVEVTYYG